MKITSKSPGRHVVGLKEKLKQTDKEKIYIFLSFYYIIQYFNALVISISIRLKSKSLKTFDIVMFTKHVFLNFALYGGSPHHLLCSNSSMYMCIYIHTYIYMTNFPIDLVMGSGRALIM